MEAVYITVAIVTGLAGIGGVTYKCTQQQRNVQRVEVNHPQPPSPLLEHIIKETIENQRNSDETEIDIKIHIQNHNQEKYDNFKTKE